jgi:hypothetical protein
LAGAANRAVEQQEEGTHRARTLLEKRLRASHTMAMSQPIDVDLPHKLGKDEAKRRIGGNIHKLHEHLPGGGTPRRAGTATR